MSYKIRNLVDELDGEPSGGIISCPEKAVLSALASFADEGGYCFPSHKKMVRRSALTRSSMINALKRLTELKLITSEPREYLDGRQAPDDVYVQVLVIAGHVDRQREADGEDWKPEEVEWINGWSSEQVNTRTYPTRPLTPRKTKGGPGNRRGGSGKQTPGGPGDGRGEGPGDGHLESVIEEPVIGKSFNEPPAAAPADAGLPPSDDQNLHDPSVETEVVEVTHYTRDGIQLWTTPPADPTPAEDPWAKFRGDYTEPDLYEPQEDWTQPDVVEAPADTEQPVEPISAPVSQEQDPRAGLATFLKVFPRRDNPNRHRIEQAWVAARARGVDAEHIIEAARAYAVEVADLDPKMIKRPAAWLNTKAYSEYEPADMAVAA